MPVQSDLQTSEWYSYFENDVLGIYWLFEYSNYLNIADI